MINCSEEAHYIVSNHFAGAVTHVGPSITLVKLALIQED